MLVVQYQQCSIILTTITYPIQQYIYYQLSSRKQQLKQVTKMTNLYNQRIRSPTIGNGYSVNGLISSKSKQLPSASQLIAKCMKIIQTIHNSQMVTYLEMEAISKKNISDPFQTLSTLLDHIHQFVNKLIETSESKQIQGLLQKQENLNRNLIKKQLEYRQQQKLLIDELCDQRSKSLKLNDYIGKLNDEIKDKDLTILHVKNQLKACQKQRKILDDSKISYVIDQKLKSFVSKQIQKDKNGFLTLGHKRRKSEDYNKKYERTENKKKTKQKQKQRQRPLSKRRNLLSAQSKINGDL